MFDITTAVIYDIETFPNCFTLHMECLNSDVSATWEISHYRDDRAQLMQWFQWLASTQTAMVGFNNINFDYPVVHFLFHNPRATVEQIYEKAMSIINAADRWGHQIWASDRFAPQVDLFSLHHFSNPAKSTSLKALQINMRSANVVDMPVKVGTLLSEEQINRTLIPYNKHDVKETKRFMHFSMDAINFRVSLIEKFGIDVLNWPDTKIGSRMMESRLGDELCYDRSSGKKKTRQTPRTRIALKDIIFPYIEFKHPEFQRVLDYLRDQVLTTDEINDIGNENPKLKTKGVFSNLKAHVGDIDFYFGTGGIHASVSNRRVIASGDWIIRDIDVASLYPSIAIQNNLAPAHLGEHFSRIYAELPKERKKWQQEKGKKCVEANTIKLAGNGVYGNSNNPYSVFYDPQFTLTITINGQLMLSMLAERLLEVPSLSLIQVNTDGITYFIHKDDEPKAAAICREWEALTKLTLEDTNYSRMFIADVNAYCAESLDGTLKLKGRYWTPDAMNYHSSIGDAQPPAWHRDLGNCVSTRAAVASMVHGVDVATFIYACTNPYDFMCRIKVGRSDKLMHGDREIQRTTRYYVSRNGSELFKLAPPTGVIGTYKKSPGVSEHDYNRVMQETGGAWDERVCTKNKSKHEERQTKIESGYKVSICNNINDFDFSNINYDWYISEAKKLLI